MVDSVPFMTVTLAEPNDAASIVSDQINAMQVAADGALVAAESAIGAISEGLSTLEPMELTEVAGVEFDVDFDWESNFNPDMSGMGGGASSTMPGQEVPFEPAEIKTTELEAFTAVEPSINVPYNWAQKPGAVPVYSGTEQQVTLPAAPDVDLNQVLAKIKEMIGNTQPPAAVPGYTPVNFADVSTGLGLKDPLAEYTQRLFSFHEPLTDTQLTDYLVSDIALSLSTGGRGLEAGVENALFLRARDRINDAYVAEYQREEAELAAQGWVIPTGSSVAILSAISAANLRATEQLNYEVMIENARLVLADRNAAREVAVKFEDVYREYLSGYYSRLLESQKQLVAENLELFRMAVEHNKLLLEELGMRIELYKAFIHASFAELEAFGKQLEAYKIQAEIRGQDAQLLATWIDAALASVKVYETQIQGAIAVMQNNKLAVEIYGEKVKAHVATVQAYATEVGAWSTEVDAMAKQIDIYTSRVQAYAARASAVESANRTEIAKAEIDLKKADIALNRFTALLQERLGELQVEAEYAKIQATIYSAQGDIEVAKIQAKSASASAKADMKKAEGDINIARASLAQEVNKVNSANQLAQAQLRVEALKAIAATSSQLAAATLSAINVGATISNGYSVGKTTSVGYNAELRSSKEERVG